MNRTVEKKEDFHDEKYTGYNRYNLARPRRRKEVRSHRNQSGNRRHPDFSGRERRLVHNHNGNSLWKSYKLPAISENKIETVTDPALAATIEPIPTPVVLIPSFVLGCRRYRSILERQICNVRSDLPSSLQKSR